MRLLPKAQEPPKPKSQIGVWAAVGYAGILVVIVVAQLFSFENFHSVIASYWLPVTTPATHLISALVVTFEVFSLPFLLRMRLSPAMRWFSMFLGWIIAVWWLFISIWLIATVNAVGNSGILGDTIAVRPGAWMVLLGLVMVILAAISAWGIWPALRSKKFKK